MRSRRAAVIASLVGALLIGGVPTLAFGEADGTYEAKRYSATAASDDVAAQKAKDEDEKRKAAEKKAAEKNKDGNKQAAEKNKDGNKQAAEKKKADDNRKNDGNRQAADEKKKDDDRKRHDNDGKKGDDRKRHDNGKKNDDRWDGDKKRDRNEQASDRKRHDHDRNGHHDKDEWKRRHHKDKHNKHWRHDHDHGRRHHYGWDTHRRYYRYGYYGPGYYDQCGYNGGYNDSYYYGPDACRYEYGGYRSHFLVDMSWDQVIPDPYAGGSEARGAYGIANLDIDVAAGVVCFRLAYDGIDRAIGAQIHPGRLGEVGPAIVLLHVGTNGDDGCVSADPAILYEIQNDPRGYYLEVNDEYHGQAMRGQLDAPDYRNRY